MTFIERSLPPGDRDDAPGLALEAPALPDAPLLSAAIDATSLHKLGRALAEATKDWAEFLICRDAGDPVGMQAAASRLAQNCRDLPARADRIHRAASARPQSRRE